MPQHLEHRVFNIQVIGNKRRALGLLALGYTVHLWRFAKEYRHRQIHRIIFEITVADGNGFIFNRFADNGYWAALAVTDLQKAGQVAGFDCQHIAFLGFVAPDCHRCHSRLIIGYFA